MEHKRLLPYKQDPPLDLMQNHMKPAHNATQNYLRSVLILSTHLPLGP